MGTEWGWICGVTYPNTAEWTIFDDLQRANKKLQKPGFEPRLLDSEACVLHTTIGIPKGKKWAEHSAMNENWKKMTDGNFFHRIPLLISVKEKKTWCEHRMLVFIFCTSLPNHIDFELMQQICSSNGCLWHYLLKDCWFWRKILIIFVILCFLLILSGECFCFFWEIFRIIPLQRFLLHCLKWIINENYQSLKKFLGLDVILFGGRIWPFFSKHVWAWSFQVLIGTEKEYMRSFEAFFDEKCENSFSIDLFHELFHLQFWLV